MNFRTLLVCLLLPLSALGQGLPSPAMNGANVQVTATGATATRGLPARWAERINVRDFGAVGDGATDDSAAFSAAITRANTLGASGIVPAIYIPAGTYYIKSTHLPAFTQNMASGIVGDGAWRTVLKIDPAYSGDLFAWSDAWTAGTQNAGGTSTTVPKKLGVQVHGLTVIGDQAASTQQNAFMLYDHNDFVWIDDVDVQFLHGRAIAAGIVKNGTSAYLRESRFSNVRVFNSGTSSIPAVEITAQCTLSCTGQDASNEIDLSGVGIYGSRGTGLLIRNENPAGGGVVRQIRISQLRIEGTENNTYGATADLFGIGASSQAAAVANISCLNCELVSPYTNYAALRLAASSAAAAPSAITFQGALLQGAGGGAGLRIEAGSNLSFRFQMLGSAQTNVYVGASPLTAGPITIDGGGNEIGASWTWSVDASAVQYVRNSMGRYGSLTPQSTTTFVASQMPDGTVNSGNARGANSVDSQTIRFSNLQVASGQFSAILSGGNNTASFTGSLIAGGNQNTSASFYSVIGGGGSNVASGSYATIPGGWNANTWGNYGLLAFASGSFSGNAGDGRAQLAFSVLRAETTSTAAVRLTTDQNTPSSTNKNTLNPNANSAWLIDLDCAYRDTVSSAVASWSWKGILLSRGAANANTSVAAPTAITGQTIGTPGATAPALAADTTTGGLSITFTAPNTDTSHIVCRAATVVVQ